MKKISIAPLLFCAVAAYLIISCKQTPSAKLNPQDFRNPPVVNSIHAWWHWVDNAITKEGITKDLEAMKKQGISTATILNVGLFDERDLGVPQVKFGTDEWYQMFEWALTEANRLGITLGAHNCDGWSSSGGPWIDPQNSMKRCIWSKSIIKGGGAVTVILPEPKGNLDFYRDISVIAFPVTEEQSSFQSAKPEILVKKELIGNILYDANPFSTKEVQNGDIIEITFNSDFNAEKIAIHPRVGFMWGDLDNIHYQVELKSSADGKVFRTVQKFKGPAMNRTSVIETSPVTSKYYRLEFSDITGAGSISMGEIELLGKDEKPAYNTSIPFHLEKTVTTMAGNIKDLRVEDGNSSDNVPLNSIIDLTANMNHSGELKWDAPAGNWEVLRIGYTTTGARNAPATDAGRGLECDKMDTAALNLHFRGFPAKLVAHAGRFAGNTFEYLFIDSWECSYQNWTGNFTSEFEKRRHYNITNWLPVICGVTVESPEATERFLHDYQQTVSDLIEEYYYKHFGMLCKKYGVKSHAEIIYGGTGYPPLDILKSNSYVDVPMFEFWASPDARTKFAKYEPVSSPVIEMPSHAGALYDKSIVPAEAYTGYANYSETPWDLKLFGDNAFCSGINQMVLHSYVHQPFEKKPGITLGQFGQSFNRHNPWWDFASQWFTYHSRVQNILQQGVPVADILYFTGDRFYDNPDSKGIYEVPDGYRIQKCNMDILMNHCTVKNGDLVLDNGMNYKVLLLPDDTYMNFSSLKRIAELVKQGAVIAGPRPIKIPGNLNYAEEEKELISLAREIWGTGEGKDADKTSYGKGKVYSGGTLKDILNEQEVFPDFAVQGTETSKLIFIHKRTGNDNVYFVVNQEDKTVDCEVVFRMTGKIPEIWNPQYGTICIADNYSESDGNTRIKFKFQPRESMFFVFRENTLPDLPKYQSYDKKYLLETFNGTLGFEEKPEIPPVKITNFASLTTFADPAIKYYSGKVKYSVDFDLPPELVKQKPLYLSVDEIRTGYEISINGNPLGCSDFPGYRFDVSGFVKDKGNKLEIRVSIPYRNRIIGDFIQYGALKELWTTSPLSSLPDKDKPLLESGILGPLAFYYR
jgi:hypothetical protein